MVIFQGTPVGSERRIASLTGIAPPPASPPGFSPSNVALLPMAPPTQWVDVHRLSGNLQVTANSSPHVKILDHMRSEVASAGGFGLPMTARHEPPRRFRISGNNLRPGASLLLGLPTSLAGTVPQNPFFISMPLFPVQTATGTVWESAVELDEEMTLALLAGGLFATNVLGVLQPSVPEQVQQLPLQPALWNRMLTVVVNEDGSNNIATASWQTLRVQDSR